MTNPQHPADSPTRRGGRPSKGLRRKLSFRAPAYLEAQLEAAAAVANRSLSEEVEYRLNRSFESLDLFAEALGGPEIAEDLRVLAMGMRRTAQSSGGMDDERTQIFATVI